MNKRGLSRLAWMLIIIGILIIGFGVWWFFLRATPSGGIFINPS